MWIRRLQSPRLQRLIPTRIAEKQPRKLHRMVLRVIYPNIYPIKLYSKKLATKPNASAAKKKKEDAPNAPGAQDEGLGIRV